MWFFYAFAFLPLLIGAGIWFKSREVTWWEWLIGAASGFVMAVIFHLIAAAGMTGDIETWSGKVVKATHHPRWVERYTTTETYTTGSGKNKQTHTRLVTKYRTHPEHWTCAANYGSSSDGWRISRTKFDEIARIFGKGSHVVTTERPWKSGFSSGDRNIYVAYNKIGTVIPVTMWKRWENRVKAAPSVFSYVKVPEGTAVWEYPENKNRFASDRLLGFAKSDIPLIAWDMMCTRLGPAKKVNVIMVGLDGTSGLGHYQEAAWIGGKKNDLVLCYGPGWSYVFGWTEQEIVKRNLETIMLEHMDGRKMKANVIPLIEEEIKKNYVIKDWSKFDYISIEPPLWSYIVFIIVMVLVQIGAYIGFHMNESKRSF